MLKKAAGRKIMIFIFLIFLSFQQLVTKAEDKIEELQLYATYAVLMDGQSGRVLYEKNASQQVPMASTTKIMTCIIALEYGNLEDVVMVSENAARMPKVKLYLNKGEQYYLKDLLYSLMLESHNDSAVAIAEHIAGSVSGFADLMNQKARDLGCYDTFFITPNGLDATAEVTLHNGEKEARVHSTTAKDLGKIMRYCITQSPKKEDFLTITRTASYSFGNVVENKDGNFVSGSKYKSCQNKNAFLTMMEGAISGKTGFTGNAGYCYVGALERQGKTYIVALMACGWPNNKGYKWSDTKKLMNYGIENYEFKIFDDVEIQQTKLAPIEVKNGQTKRIGQQALVSMKAEEVETADAYNDNKQQGVLMREEEKIEIKYNINRYLEAPVYKGELLGSIQYVVEGDVWKTNHLIAQETIERINFKWCFEKVVQKFSL